VTRDEYEAEARARGHAMAPWVLEKRGRISQILTASCSCGKQHVRLEFLPRREHAVSEAEAPHVMFTGPWQEEEAP